MVQAAALKTILEGINIAFERLFFDSLQQIAFDLNKLIHNKNN
jgi:hypothetical protein